MRQGVENFDGQITLEFKVQDTGIGMTEQCSRLFKSFPRPISQQPGSMGTGLGLAICKQLTEVMGQDFGRKSTSGGFDVYLHGSVHDPAGSTTESVAAEGAGFRGARVLLVEDNAINRQVAPDFTGHGVSVEMAEMVGRLLKVTQGDFDLVLMDIQMPEMGHSATALIRQSKMAQKFRLLR